MAKAVVGWVENFAVVEIGANFNNSKIFKHFYWRVVSIGSLTAFYVVLVPMEHILSKPPHGTYVIVSFCTFQKGSNF